MSFAESLVGFKPPSRFDGNPWTRGRIERGDSETGPWVVLETQVLNPPDANPQAPQARNFTFTAINAADWYRVVWLDALDRESPSGAAFSGTYPGSPSATDVRALAPPAFDWAGYGYPAPAVGEPELLDTPVAWAAAYVEETSGRVLATLPTGLAAIAEQAVVLRTMQQVAGGAGGALQVLFDAPWLKSFTAGSYSETRFSPAELAGARAVNPLPQLADLLWLLMTDAKRDEWLERVSGVRRPAGVFIEPHWGHGHEVPPLAWGDGIRHPWEM